MTLHDQGFWAINAGHWRRFGRDGFSGYGFVHWGSISTVPQIPSVLPFKGSNSNSFSSLRSCWVTYSIQILSGCLSNTGTKIHWHRPHPASGITPVHVTLYIHLFFLLTFFESVYTVSYLDSTPIARFQAALHRSDIRKVKFCGLTNSWLDHPTQHMFLGHRTRPCWISTVRRRRNCNFANCHQKKRKVFFRKPNWFFGKIFQFGMLNPPKQGSVFF